jgi:hypothetical protein
MAETTYSTSQPVAGALKTKNLAVYTDTYYLGMPLKWYVTGTAANTGTGNSAISAIKADRNMRPGAYRFTFSGADAGTLTDPSGNRLWTGTLVTTTAIKVAGLEFTWTVGGTAQINGDYITITIGTTGYYEYNITEPEVIAWEDKVVSGASTLLCAVSGSEIKESGIVNDSNGALTVTEHIRVSLLDNGIILRA